MLYLNSHAVATNSYSCPQSSEPNRNAALKARQLPARVPLLDDRNPKRYWQKVTLKELW